MKPTSKLKWVPVEAGMNRAFCVICPGWTEDGPGYFKLQQLWSPELLHEAPEYRTEKGRIAKVAVKI